MIERRRERPPVADDDRLRDVLRRLEVVLEVLRGDVLAAGRDDDVLLAVGDLDEAVVVDLGDVARVEPAVGVEHLGRRGGILVVAAEDRVAADQELAVLGDSELEAGQRGADRPEAPALGRVRRRGRRALAEAVALEDPDPDRVEELGDLLAERRAARDRRPQAPAEAVADLREDEPVGDAGLQLQRCRRRAGPPPARLPTSRPTASDQSASRRLTPVVSSIAATTAVWIFSYTRGTLGSTVGRTVSERVRGLQRIRQEGDRVADVRRR